MRTFLKVGRSFKHAHFSEGWVVMTWR